MSDCLTFVLCFAKAFCRTHQKFCIHWSSITLELEHSASCCWPWTELGDMGPQRAVYCPLPPNLGVDRSKYMECFKTDCKLQHMNTFPLQNIKTSHVSWALSLIAPSNTPPYTQKTPMSLFIAFKSGASSSAFPGLQAAKQPDKTGVGFFSLNILFQPSYTLPALS